jgi:hypothetical protein
MPNSGVRMAGIRRNHRERDGWGIGELNPWIHMAQEGVSRGQWIIALAVKPQWVYTR